MRERRQFSIARLALAATVAALAGCGGGGGGGGGGSATPTASGGPPPPPMVGADAPPPPPPAAGDRAELRRTIGQTTTDVRDFDAEMQGGQDVRVSDGRITARDPITLQGNAYVSIVGQAAVLQIQHALNLYHAMNDRYPASTDEFMREIIQANNIRLPQLPGYQEYAYDARNNTLVILEYPDRMEALREQVRGGRP